MFTDCCTGGSALMMPKDMDQAAKMQNMRIKIDVWTQGLEESFREKVRETLKDLFCQLPARRVWFDLKRIRPMLLNNNGSIRSQLEVDHLKNGPEDVVVNGKHNPYESVVLMLLTLFSKSLNPQERSLSPDAFRHLESYSPDQKPEI